MFGSVGKEVGTEKVLRASGGFAIVRLPDKRGRQKRDGDSKEGVDEKRETLHNLTSLLQRTKRFVANGKSSTE